MPSNFLKVKCPACGNVQVVFSHATVEVKCLKCGEKLTDPAGGKAYIHAEILEVFE